MAKYSRARLKKDLIKEIEKVGDLKNLSKRSLNKVGNELIAEMKDNIAKGISPITGRRFPGYKKPSRYPGDQKPARPVNLKLSGEFLDDMTTDERSGSKPSITLYYKGKDSDDKERGHREGANGQPKRPTIPQGRESFSIGILTKIENILKKLIESDLD